jgi:tetratricopeptide (TPR) repeat protein
MKSERRHELQHNALDAEIAKTAAFFKQHGMRLLWGAVIVAVVVLAIRWYAVDRSRAQAEYAAHYSSLSGSLPYATGEKRQVIISGLKALVEEGRIPRLAALACVDLGDAYASRMVEAGEEERASLVAQARSYYQQAIEGYPTEALACGKARIGLAKLAESLGDFEEAGKQYQAAEEIIELRGQPVAALARSGRDKLENLARPVALATTAPATQPAELEAETDASQPAPTTP